MPGFTKQAIRNPSMKLLNERPVSQITVKDIVQDCGINRNSFYYHYQDIPSMIEEIILEETDEIIRRHPTGLRIYGGYLYQHGFCGLSHKRSG